MPALQRQAMPQTTSAAASSCSCSQPGGEKCRVARGFSGLDDSDGGRWREGGGGEFGRVSVEVWEGDDRPDDVDSWPRGQIMSDHYPEESYAHFEDESGGPSTWQEFEPQGREFCVRSRFVLNAFSWHSGIGGLNGAGSRSTWLNLGPERMAARSVFAP
jgi:hypothetical protein